MLLCVTDMKALLLMMALGRGADVATSLTAFHHGAIERNPMIASSRPLPFIAQMTAETVGQAYLIHALDTHGHPRWAKAIAFVQIGASSGATFGNVLTIRRQIRIASSSR